MTPAPSKARNAGRPTASLLTAEKITEAAQALLAREGNFTMSKLAQLLGVAPSSLYNHVASRDEVLAAISDHVAQSIDTQALQDAADQVREGKVSALGARALWIEATEQWARSYRQAFSLAPAIVMTLAVTPVRKAPATLAMYEHVISAFMAFGMTPRHALLTVEAIEAFLLGAATDLHAPTDIFDPGQHAEAHPLMAEAYSQLGKTPQNEAFEIGLLALLTGISASISPS